MAVKSNKLTHEEWMQQIDREERRFSKRLPELLEQYEGEYIAMYDGEVVGHNADDSILFGEMHKKLGYVPFMIQRVSREPDVLVIELVEDMS